MEKLKKNVNGVDIECTEEETQKILAQWKEFKDSEILKESQKNDLKIAEQVHKSSAITKLKNLGFNDQELKVFGIQ